jgi:hypothetical protein
MSPLWPDFAIARMAWDDATDRGLVDPTATKADGAPAERARDWLDRARRKAPRRPIRRAVASCAL